MTEAQWLDVCRRMAVYCAVTVGGGLVVWAGLLAVGVSVDPVYVFGLMGFVLWMSAEYHAWRRRHGAR